MEETISIKINTCGTCQFKKGSIELDASTESKDTFIIKKPKCIRMNRALDIRIIADIMITLDNKPQWCPLSPDDPINVLKTITTVQQLYDYLYNDCLLPLSYKLNDIPINNIIKSVSLRCNYPKSNEDFNVVGIGKEDNSLIAYGYYRGENRSPCFKLLNIPLTDNVSIHQFRIE